MIHIKENMFKFVMRAGDFEVTGKPPIGMKWVDTDKSYGVGKMNVSSRWFARDSREKKSEDLFFETTTSRSLGTLAFSTGNSFDGRPAAQNDVH